MMNSDQFHKSKLLLHLYRDVVWRMEEDLQDAEETAGDLGGRRLSELTDFLSFGMDQLDGSDVQAFEERLMSIAESIEIIRIIDHALIKLRSSPEHGEMFYNILYANYISKDRMSQPEIQNKLGISESTYFRHKKNAIQLFSVILWGYILPSLQDVWSTLI